MPSPVRRRFAVRVAAASPQQVRSKSAASPQSTRLEETSLTSLGGSVVWIDFVEGTRVADRLPSPDKQALFDKAGERPLDVPSIHVECFDQVAGLCRLIPIHDFEHGLLHSGQFLERMFGVLLA